MVTLARCFGALVAGAVLASCIEPSLVDCGDGTLCPATKFCIPGGGCADATDVVACDGLVDGDACTTVSGGGICAAGVCVAARCGDGKVNGNEVCDDGNLSSGDGCSGTCASDETCGNGIVELAEACDCGDEAHPGLAGCEGTFNGGGRCRLDCELARCGDGVLDALEACDDGNLRSGDGCAGNCTSAEVCGNSVLDVGEQCDDGNLSDHDGCQHTCQAQRCGDGIEDPLEACDDGNLAAGDGCTPDCASDETCGNGAIDFFAGEQCDDDNLFSRDGCDGGCRSESATWLQGNLAFPGRESTIFDPAGAAYDAFRHRVVYLAQSVVWEWDGDAWRKVPTTVTPSSSLGSTLAFDAARGHIVSFGGPLNGSATKTADTFTFDGVNWTPRAQSPAVAPPARGRSAMAYDAARQRTVLFGGVASNSGADLGDTWEWDGTTWTQRTLVPSPSARHNMAMVYDAKRARIVLFGGGGSTMLADTWEYDGTAWTQRTPATSPPARGLHGMAYDAKRQRTVIFGGTTSSFVRLGDTWEYDGTTWVETTPTVSPSARTAVTLVYDSDRHRTMLLGGDQNGNDTWEYDGATWTQRTPTFPTPRYGHQLAADPLRGRLVFFGGRNNANAYVAETWEWDGSAWSYKTTTTAPSARDGFGMAFHLASNNMVLFGGGAPTPQSDTWIWSGTTWTLQSGTAPPARRDSPLAYDAKRGRLVMFGGTGATATLADTWEWDGTSWMQRTPTTSPPARARHALGYDAISQRVILFGGQSGSSALADTWAWDGTTWTQLTTATAPGARFDSLLIEDRSAGGLIMFGGANAGTFADTWIWRSNAWQSLSTASQPTARSAAAAAYDVVRAQIVLFGGRDTIASTVSGGTWFFNYLGPRAREACESNVDYDRDGASGCADTDCWGVCTPTCAPVAADAGTCNPALGARCGNTVCEIIETCRACPSDCGTCAAICGDAFCDTPETRASCPADCPP